MECKGVKTIFFSGRKRFGSDAGGTATQHNPFTTAVFFDVLRRVTHCSVGSDVIIIVRGYTDNSNKSRHSHYYHRCVVTTLREGVADGRRAGNSRLSSSTSGGGRREDGSGGGRLLDPTYHFGTAGNATALQSRTILLCAKEETTTVEGERFVKAPLKFENKKMISLNSKRK